MSIYVGDNKNDLHWCTSGNTVSRSVFVGNGHVWPLYEFSFMDGTVQKCDDDVEACGKTDIIEFRSCEDSWWHRLKFDVFYKFDQTDSETWLKYDASNFINKKYVHWIEMLSASNGCTVTPKNSAVKQLIDVSDTYNNVNSGNCTEGVIDTTLSYKIYPNAWFKRRSGSLYGKQYDEWDHNIGNTTVFVHTLVPSDNTPTYFFIQEANSWGDNKQIIEFTVQPKVTSASGGIVNLTWKIYSNSTSGVTIYYGTNIASNNKTLGDEIYEYGKMWITGDCPYCVLNNDAKCTIDENGVATWTMTATWANNTVSENNIASHNLIVEATQNGNIVEIPSSLSSSESFEADIKVYCEHASAARNCTFTLNIASYANWRPGSASDSCMQEGDGETIACKISDSIAGLDTASDTYHLKIDSLPSGEKTYSITVDKSAIGPDEESFTVTSICTESPVSGSSTILYVKCPYNGGPTTQIAIGQTGSSSTTTGVDIIALCKGDDSEIKSIDKISDGVYKVTVKPHKDETEKNAIITVYQKDPSSDYTLNKSVTVTHITNPITNYNYTYVVTINESESESAHISSVETPAKGQTTKTMYAHLLESCIAVKETGESVPAESYENVMLSGDGTLQGKGVKSKSGETLNNVIFNFIYGNDSNTWSGTSESAANGSYGMKLTINGSENSDVTDEITYGDTVHEIKIVKDEYTAIGNTEGSTVTFIVAVTKEGTKGGLPRTGVFTANHTNSSASASTEWKQPSSVSTIPSDETAPYNGISPDRFNKELGTYNGYSLTKINEDFEISSIEEKGNGEYIVTIRATKDYKATESNDAEHSYVNPEITGYTSPSADGTYEIKSSDKGNLKLGVSIQASTKYTSEADTNKTKERYVNARVCIGDKCSDYCQNKKQEIAPLTIGPNKIDKGVTLKWTRINPSSDTELSNNLNPITNSFDANVNILKVEASTDNYTETFKAYLDANSTDDKYRRIFTLKWPKEEILTEWPGGWKGTDNGIDSISNEPILLPGNHYADDNRTIKLPQVRTDDSILTPAENMYLDNGKTLKNYTVTDITNPNNTNGNTWFTVTGAEWCRYGWTSTPDGVHMGLCNVGWIYMYVDNYEITTTDLNDAYSKIRHSKFTLHTNQDLRVNCDEDDRNGQKIATTWEYEVIQAPTGYDFISTKVHVLTSTGIYFNIVYKIYLVNYATYDKFKPLIRNCNPDMTYDHICCAKAGIITDLEKVAITIHTQDIYNEYVESQL